MFKKRQNVRETHDLLKFLSVAETGKISAAADRLGMTQPALSRVVVRLEGSSGAGLFERLPTGVRLTSLGTTAVDLARHVLREIEASEEKMDAALSGPYWLLPRHRGSDLDAGRAAFGDPKVPRKPSRDRAEADDRGLSAGTAPASRRPDRSPLRRSRHRGTATPVPEAGTAPRRDVRHRCPRWPPAARKDGGSRRSRGLSVDRFRVPSGTGIRDGRPSLSSVLDDIHGRTSRRVRTLVRARNGGLLPDGGRPLSLVGVPSIPGQDAGTGPEAFTS